MKYKISDTGTAPYSSSVKNAPSKVPCGLAASTTAIMTAT
jgi:hypothetical protein